MAFLVYLLECADRTFYCGYTHNMKKRLKMHRAGKASKYTRARLPVKLVYIEEHPTQRDAMKREYAIKHLSRMQKKKLVSSQLNVY